MKYIICSLIISFVILQLSAQQQSFSDPAQQYNRLLIEKNNGTYYQIQNFKVIGTPYLYGDGNEGLLYKQGVVNGKINYNTYNHQVELIISSAVPDIRDVKSVDSFTMSISNTQFKGNIKFVNASYWDAKNKFFLQEVQKTANYTLYKKFFSTLEVVTTNYVQSELRQFELNSDYYYMENGKTELKKLKTSENGLKSEFSTKKSCFANFDFSTLSSDKENILKSFFQTLDTCK